ncbi:Methyltransferase type 11 [Emticicia oligotrophica DSM 17448]|uniref:Methyltransferase type 11 n=1 Tax=Emticicia oligotrophica (strain DSM 17448 / CIP 109782 / MTCC 6937 / GPTSA100-15) TaxID=929562 RepID=A0ABM5N735_EMTOG|nr:class I SAM-dependent methyltransferase [Emticicia oligotrophica]AFK05351.1 Methyltransferase type 11 [Emticicia oligotrophica DSM 17448]
MLINYEEYKMMYEAEGSLWWYKILHEKVLSAITERYKEDNKIKILDAGCGTGGLMDYLIRNGYTNIQGFDFSIDAVSFCKQRDLDVKHLDITKLDKVFNHDEFDVIVNNDVVYQFEDNEITKIFGDFSRIIKPTGIIITNNNAFNIFRGTHDIAVGGMQRFTIKSFRRILNVLPLRIYSFTYWSLFLSPIILLVRLIQQFQIKLNLINLNNIKSDVKVPSEIINNLFFQLVKFESYLFKKSFFGSSLFIIIGKKN